MDQQDSQGKKLKMTQTKSQLDKFYTKPELAQRLVSTIEGDFDRWLEPSACSGSFLRVLPHPRTGIDLEPDDSEIWEGDFFDYEPPEGERIAVVGNPPFGYQSRLAKDFFNRAASFASLIAFILPRTFRKTLFQNRLDLNWVLQYEEILPRDSFYLLEGSSMPVYSVSTVWQIWVPGKRSKISLPTTHPDWTWCSREEAQYAFRRCGGSAGRCLESFEQYATQGHYFFNCTPEVFNRLCSLYSTFNDIAQDTVGNPSIGKGEVVLAYSKALKEAESQL